MKKYLVILSAIVLVLTFSWLSVSVSNATPLADCSTFSTGDIPDLSSLNISFNCISDNTVYFGACDSGSVPNDDLFNITFQGSVVAYNQYVGGEEFVSVGAAQVLAGTHSATLNSLSTTPFPPATYSYAISSDMAELSSYLGGACGVDFGGFNPGGECVKNVPVFTTDTAPSDGTLRFDVLFGEQNREEGRTLRIWDVEAGQQLNNDMVSLKAPKWARLWWQPDGASSWYLLTSQYWLGDGTSASEYGVDCKSTGAPSYHTSFSSAIPESEIPIFNP